VVKVAHHGSADQNERMYQRLHAAVGLISVGAGNSYGHPTDRLLGMLARAGTLAERTDLEGMILVSPVRGGGETVWSERSMPQAKLTHH
jgi:competence protein ComEC